MKKVITIAALLLMSTQAFALNHRHAAKLEAAGCTQVQEANGTCNLHKPKHNRLHSESDAMAAARDWDAQHAAQQATDDDSNLSIKQLARKYHISMGAAADQWDAMHSQPTRMQCADLPVDATNADRRNCID